MTMHQIDFIAKETFVGGIETDAIPANLTQEQKEDWALTEIEAVHPELDDIEITNIKEV